MNESIKERALAWVNDRRKLAGLEPLAEWPANVRTDRYKPRSSSCPVAQALPGDARVSNTFIQDAVDPKGIELPDYMGMVVDYFDDTERV